MQAVAHVCESMQVLMLLKKSSGFRTAPNGFVVVFGAVRVFVCVELAAAEWPRKRT
jgi:hypothetical protein